ncbi:hypothetical protein C8F04DRAFT_1177777 [Mycena alexandri]|uniref:Uncharacterized protein n=1 Tax=Mycena alexandri TaxID=1745969 RepID=A0AAD6XAF5_9AGAR|nr:hypothetical protein C8F04DRAFT_1177777 [Mycena alexandri]
MANRLGHCLSFIIVLAEAEGLDRNSQSSYQKTYPGPLGVLLAETECLDTFLEKEIFPYGAIWSFALCVPLIMHLWPLGIKELPCSARLRPSGQYRRISLSRSMNTLPKVFSFHNSVYSGLSLGIHPEDLQEGI